MNDPVNFADPLGLQQQGGGCPWCGEYLGQIGAVGPLDALQGFQLALEAFEQTNRTGLPGMQHGPQDTFRHCYWSCTMTQEIGEDQAKEVGDMHEACGDNSAFDYASNASGRRIGTSGADCTFECAAQALGGTP